MDRQIKRMLPDRPWEVAALAQGRRNALVMVERSMLAAEGDPLSIAMALPPAFLREVVRLAADPDARPCMECHGSGSCAEIETGPGTCHACDGMGLLPPEPGSSIKS